MLFYVLMFIIIGIVYELIAKIGVNKRLNELFTASVKEPQIVHSKFNTKNKNETRFFLDGDYLHISTDLKLYEYLDDGKFNAYISSTFENTPVKAKLISEIDWKRFDFTTDFQEEIKLEKWGFIYSSHESKEILKILKERFELPMENYHKGIAFIFDNADINFDRHKQVLSFKGKFPDGGVYSLSINFQSFRLEIKAQYSSLRTKSNYPLVFIEK